jgi:hypothetical protein
MNTRITATSLTLAALALALPSAAQELGKNGATVRKWASGLAGPQGIARAAGGEILIAEHDAGRVTRFAADGTKKGVLAEGLQAPSWALFHQGVLFVCERKGNSVARITPSGELTRLPGEVIDPLGIIPDPAKPGALLVLSHRASLIRRFNWSSDAKQFTLESEPAITPPGGGKYGWRDLICGQDGTIYVTDEVVKAVLRRKPNGQFEEWSKNLLSPSGLGFSAKGDLYVTEEGGRVSRLAADGTPTVLAEGLGAARAILFLNETTMLVTDRRGGDVWEITLPK